MGQYTINKTTLKQREWCYRDVREYRAVPAGLGMGGNIEQNQLV